MSILADIAGTPVLDIRFDPATGGAANPWLAVVKLPDGSLWDITAHPTMARACVWAARQARDYLKESKVSA